MSATGVKRSTAVRLPPEGRSASRNQIVDAQGGFAKYKSFTDSFDVFGENNQFVKSQVGAQVAAQWYPNVLSPYKDQIKLAAVPFKDKDGNPFTVADPNWQPLANTPNYPDYTSGANSLVAAMTRSMELFFRRSIAGPESTPCVAIAHTSVAPFSVRISAAATICPAPNFCRQ